MINKKVEKPEKLIFIKQKIF